MGSVNRLTLVGRLTADPEMRVMTDGKRLATFSVATSDMWKDEKGERQERTQFHKITVFNEALAGIAEKHLRKGDLVHVEGPLEYRKWTDREGGERTAAEVVLRPFRGELTMLGSPRRDAEPEPERPAPPAKRAAALANKR